MKTLSIRLLFVWLFVAFGALVIPTKAIAGDDVTVKAVAGWIVKQTKENVQWPQAIKIARAVFDKVDTHRIDPYLVIAMMSAESTFNHKAGNKSGARGLMQVMPRWHRDKIKGRNILDIQTNVEVGLQILQDCLIKAGDKMSSGLRCYSGGASKKYETKIKLAHASVKEAVIQSRFDQEVPIVATASFNQPRYWHEQMERYEHTQAVDRRRTLDSEVAGREYDRLIVAMNQHN